MKKGFGNFVHFLALRNQSGKTGTPPKPPRCPFPNCGVEIVLVRGRPAVCDEHFRLIEDVRFILNHLRAVEPPKKGGKKDD